MTAPALTFGVPFQVPTLLDRGVSDAADRLRHLWTDAADLSGSISVWEPRKRAREALISAFVETSEPNWDSEGAAPADALSYMYARSFIDALPISALTSDVYVDPDGELCLEWDNGPRAVFSVSIGRDGTLTYAGLFGASKSHGVEPFTDSIPVVIAAGIDRALSRT